MQIPMESIVAGLISTSRTGRKSVHATTTIASIESNGVAGVLAGVSGMAGILLTVNCDNFLLKKII